MLIKEKKKERVFIVTLYLEGLRKPGVKVAPAGTTVQELIDNYCGGMLQGHIFKGYLPGGASGGILPAKL